MCSARAASSQHRSLRTARSSSASPSSSTSWASSWQSVSRTTVWWTSLSHSPSLNCSAWGTSSPTGANCYTRVVASLQARTQSAPTCSPSCCCLSPRLPLRRARRPTQWAASTKTPSPSSLWIPRNQNHQPGITVYSPGMTSSWSIHTGASVPEKVDQTTGNICCFYLVNSVHKVFILFLFLFLLQGQFPKGAEGVGDEEEADPVQ